MSSQAIEYPRIVAPVAGPSLTPEQAAKGHKTVTMVFDHDVLLTVDWHTKIAFTKGVHEVPEHLADHFFLRNHNVRRYNTQVAVSSKIIQPTASEIQAIKTSKSRNPKK